MQITQSSTRQTAQRLTDTRPSTGIGEQLLCWIQDIAETRPNGEACYTERFVRMISSQPSPGNRPKRVSVIRASSRAMSSSSAVTDHQPCNRLTIRFMGGSRGQHVRCLVHRDSCGSRSQPAGLSLDAGVSFLLDERAISSGSSMRSGSGSGIRADTQKNRRKSSKAFFCYADNMRRTASGFIATPSGDNRQIMVMT